MRIYSPECQSVLPQRVHRIIFFAAVGILFVHSSEETAPIEQNEYETVPTTNINSNNAIVLREESCVRERYHPAENVNECRMLVKKALEDGSIDKSFEDSPIDTLSVEDYPSGCVFRRSNKYLYFNRRSSSRTDCSAEKSCLCWKKQPSCALNITLSNANITNSGNQRNVTGAIQIFPADKDPRCYCCQRVSEEAELTCLSKTACQSTETWGILVSILWVTLQIGCCCFLPISLLIMVYYRRKRLKNRRSVYSTGDRNNSTVQMRTISLQNYQHPGRPRQNSNYALQTAQVVSSPSYGGQQVVRAIPIGANTARVNSRQQRQTNTTTTDFVSTSALPPPIHVQPVQRA